MYFKLYCNHEKNLLKWEQEQEQEEEEKCLGRVYTILIWPKVHFFQWMKNKKTRTISQVWTIVKNKQ